jgi:hypothetical protein
MRGLLTALLCSAAAGAQEAERLEAGPRISLAAGVGAAAFGTAGLHLELRSGHFAGFVGIGADVFSLSPAPSFAVGARFLSGDGEGLLLTLAFAFSIDHQAGDPNTREYEDLDDRYLGLTAGWRFRHRSGLFAEVAAGATLFATLDRGFNLGGSGRWQRGWYPDVDLALGFEF